MTIYKTSFEKEMQLKKIVCKAYKRYRIGSVIFYCYLVMDIIFTAALSVIMFQETLHPEEAIFSIVIAIGVGLFFFLPGIVFKGWTVSGGRDIIGTRKCQKITFEENNLQNVWTPIFKQITPADIVRYTINYSDIKKIDYNLKYHRLEIWGKELAWKLKTEKQEMNLGMLRI